MFDVFNNRDLQNTKALMSGNTQTTVADLLGLIDRELSVRSASMKQVDRPKRRACPSCGRGVLRPTCSHEGLNRVGCRLCHYSEVVA